MPSVNSEYWLLGFAVVAVSGIISLAIAAWLVRELARAALERSTQKDVPQVLSALTGLVDKVALLMPWSRRPGKLLSQSVPGGFAGRHTDSDENCGGSEPR